MRNRKHRERGGILAGRIFQKWGPRTRYEAQFFPRPQSLGWGPVVLKNKSFFPGRPKYQETSPSPPPSRVGGGAGGSAIENALINDTY